MTGSHDRGEAPRGPHSTHKGGADEVPLDQQRQGRTPWLRLALILAVLLRIGLSLEYQARHPWADRPVIDEASYERWALEVASGDFVGQGVFFQEPFYAYSLAPIYRLALPMPVDETGRVAEVGTRRQRTAVRHAQAVLGALLVYLVFVLTRRAFGVGPGLIAAFAMATYRPLLLLPSLLLKPNEFLPVVTGLLVLLLGALQAQWGTARSRWRWLGVGLLGGVAALLRGNALLLLPVLVLTPLLFQRSRQAACAAILVALGALTLLLPVALRNQAVGGVFALSTSGAGTNVFGGNAEENPYGIATEFPWVRGIPEHEAADWRREAERRVGHPLDAGEVSRYWLGELGRSLVRDPAGHALRLWRKLRLSLGRLEVPDNHDIEWDARYLWSLRLPLPGWGLWGSLGLAGLIVFLGAGNRLRSAHSPAGGVLAAAFLLYLGTIVATVTSGRIRLMLVPLLMPFAAWMLWLLLAPVLSGVKGLSGVFGNPERVPLPRLLLALAFGCALVFTPVLPAAMVAQKRDGRDMNHVRILLERPDGLDQAQALAQELARKYPRDPRLNTLLAEVHFRRAGVLLAEETPERASAGEELRAAMERLAPVASDARVAPKDRFRARVLAGLCQLRAGTNPGAARRHFEAALAWDPGDRIARLGLANALALEAEDCRAGGDREGALGGWERARELIRQLRAEVDEEALAELEADLDQKLQDRSR